MRKEAVLFDLDGTLADTATDLASALNQVLKQDGRPPLPFEKLRPWVSHGAARMIRIAYGDGLNDTALQALRVRFLDCYEASVCQASALFDGVAEMLATLDAASVPWGIVTNKPGRFTQPLLEALGLGERAGAVVSGDTLAHAKPHPMPLWHAAQQLGVDARACTYVGDNIRDIQAGRAAGMYTIAAAWGYIPEDDDPAQWEADTLLASPRALTQWLNGTGALGRKYR